jgi:hypothetical protein
MAAQVAASIAKSSAKAWAGVRLTHEPSNRSRRSSRCTTPSQARRGRPERERGDRNRPAPAIPDDQRRSERDLEEDHHPGHYPDQEGAVRIW